MIQAQYGSIERSSDSCFQRSSQVRINLEQHFAGQDRSHPRYQADSLFPLSWLKMAQELEPILFSRPSWLTSRVGPFSFPAQLAHALFPLISLFPHSWHWTNLMQSSDGKVASTKPSSDAPRSPFLSPFSVSCGQSFENARFGKKSDPQTGAQPGSTQGSHPLPSVLHALLIKGSLMACSQGLQEVANARPYVVTAAPLHSGLQSLAGARLKSTGDRRCSSTQREHKSIDAASSP
eukprot:TRINITY_DN31829_c0_g1_i1.p1 TRINITY_DN31829_c0_g1~~TRINITY_DN31829_c0_g1_i1.p1  ORF type:complete len:235 (-),score=4.18 TRINITY_DN31829_c0_g1_i1:80-784(-)